MKILVTGSAGFIGFHLARRLLTEGHDVVGYDGMTDYYDVRLKQARHAALGVHGGFRPVIGMLENADLVRATVSEFAPEIVLHFAAQAGVRYSMERPDTYIGANVVGSFNLLEALRETRPAHLIFASTSSVYGARAATAFSETDRTDFPASIYAATKRGAEALAHSYAHLFGLPTTVVRPFTVYGPWGRPDMAALRFATAIDRGEAIDVYGHGQMTRDFTFVDDVVEAVMLLSALPPAQNLGPFDSLSPVAPWRTVNIAGGQPVALLDFIAAFESALGKPALKNFLPMQPGDVAATRADTRLLRALTGYVPDTGVADGVQAFVTWYRAQWPALQT